jgi:hypothetical protein
MLASRTVVHAAAKAEPIPSNSRKTAADVYRPNTTKNVMRALSSESGHYPEVFRVAPDGFDSVAETATRADGAASTQDSARPAPMLIIR